MDKEQAITFIQQKLDQGFDRESIARMLTQELKAPLEMVERFVAQTADKYQPAPPPPPPPPAPPQSNLPAWLQDTMIAPAQHNAAPAIASAPVIPAQQPKITNTKEAADFTLTELSKGRTQPDIAIDLAQLTGEPLELVQKFVALTAAKNTSQFASPEMTQTKPAGRLDELENPAWEKYVLKELRRNRKRSDIVMVICERTGIEWSHAQRFVGQVEAEHYAKIRASQQFWVIPVGILFIVGGLALGILSALSFLSYFDYRFTPVIPVTLEASAGLFLLGIGLLAGGIVGIVLAVRAQVDT